MDYFLKSHLFNRIIILSIVAAFSLTIVQPAQAHCARVNTNLNTVQFTLRIEKLIKKINKYKDQMNSGKLVETLVDIQAEVEAYTGRKIDISKELKNVEKEVKKSNHWSNNCPMQGLSFLCSCPYLSSMGSKSNCNWRRDCC
ncbi:MAG TPA: hypothetical protein PLC42_01850 [Parachlamydiaceae bacterium]|nr:hypothetical protein [Parachlamydiaceae bacterium]